ncbi:hypothetical protein D1007_15701 [Hordeum vulgare]|nr:hypothetical protein D1007_15701 [Hordeum vulgare]
MSAEPTSLAVLMAKADKYATTDSAMRIKVTASDKVVPTPATPKPAGDNRGSQNNYKHKADQMDPRSNSKLVANMEGEASASQAGPPRKRPNRSNPNWLPRQSLEQLLDAPCKIHSGAMSSTHTIRQCSVARRLSQGDGLPAPPASPPPDPPEVVAPSPSLRPPAPPTPESAYAALLEAGSRFRSPNRFVGAAVGVIGLKAVQIFSDHTAIFTLLQNEVILGCIVGDGVGSHANLLLHTLQLRLRAVALGSQLAQV